MKKHILPIIVLSQFCCTSLWFAGNGVMGDLADNFQLADNALGHLTAAVQFGFICGTLFFALLAIADRFSPSKVFFVSAVIAAIFNLGTILEGNGLFSLLSLRFMTGFFLAGIYPVGMKIAADYFQKGLGKSLGFLVGALVLGTAFPHFLKSFTISIPWKLVLASTSALAILGGLLILGLVPDGPFRKSGPQVKLSAFLKVFENQQFRSAAFGYFGHMWELYAFWAFVPIIISTYLDFHPTVSLNVSFWAFIVIGAGGIACVIGAYLAQRIGTKKTAIAALSLSCLCCLISPLIFQISAPVLFLSFLIFWGLVVIADSPLFSTLVAKNARPEIKGTALTIVNCIGFSITILSIQLINILRVSMDLKYIFMILAFGPVLGLIALLRKEHV